MDKFVSHRTNEGYYSVHMYHPVNILLVPVNVRSKRGSTKVVWRIGKKMASGNIGLLPDVSFAQKQEALEFGQTYLEVLIQRLMEAPKVEETKSINFKLSRKEALEVLDLQEGASKEQIEKAFKRILKAVHPDVGGSSFLTKQVNLARDTLLG